MTTLVKLFKLITLYVLYLVRKPMKWKVNCELVKKNIGKIHYLFRKVKIGGRGRTRDALKVRGAVGELKVCYQRIVA